MKIILDVYKNRPVKTVCSLLVVALSIITLTMFQDIKVETFKAFIDFLVSNKDQSPVLLTWFFNLFTFALLFVMGIYWMKDTVRENDYDIYPVIGRLVSLITSLAHFIYSIVFAKFIFLKLLGIVVGVGFVLLIINANNSKK